MRPDQPVLSSARMTGRNAMKFAPQCIAAVAAFLLVAAVAGVAPPARAEDYPVRPVTLIVPYTPGGSTANLARIAAQKLQQRIRHPRAVGRQPGASNR